ncbi:MAG: 50S ribosomal protein L5 [bacterium]
MPRLLENYRESVAPSLMKKFGFTNVFQVPRLEKIVVSMGLGQATQEPKVIDIAMEDLSMITGQRPTITRAKKSVSNFKLRAGTPIGVKVTLRGAMMYEFLDRLVNVAIPRVRDFRGLPVDSFDGRGNYSFGVEEQVIFPEIRYDQIRRVLGMNITIVTTAETDEQAFEFLRDMGVPFKRTREGVKVRGDVITE